MPSFERTATRDSLTPTGVNDSKDEELGKFSSRVYLNCYLTYNSWLRLVDKYLNLTLSMDTFVSFNIIQYHSMSSL